MKLQKSTTQEYWLLLYPYTFIFESTLEALFYNSETGYSYLCKYTSSIKKIIEDIQKPSNAYCIAITEVDLQNYEIKHLVHELRQSFSGELIEQKVSQGKPFVFKPISRLRNDIGILRENNKRGISDSVLQFVNEVSIFLDSNCKQNCSNCNMYFRQLDYCNKNEKNIEQTDTQIKFLHKIEMGGVMKIIFSGGNVFESKSLISILNHFRESRFKKIIQFNYLNFPGKDTILGYLSYNVMFEILVHFPIDKPLLNKVISALSINNGKWKFVVTNISEYRNVEQIINNNKLNALIKPFFTKHNLSFFKNVVYIITDDFKFKISKTSVLARKKVNENDFGKLIIMTDGKVYANPNFPALGTIHDDIRELVYKEMVKGISWRRIRDMEPCCNCVYQWLCPSPSNYELAIDKPNLCHIVKQTKVVY